MPRNFLVKSLKYIGAN